MMQEFVQQIEDTVREATYDMHTALPGTITRYDAASGMAEVKPEGTVRMKNGKELPYPSIVKVPVIFPRGQDMVVAWPVKPGDGCLVIVCENDLKPWASHGAETDSNMKFDLTNAVCIPGLYGEGNGAMQRAMEEDAVVIENGEAVILLKKDGMEVETPGCSIKMQEGGVRLECGDGVIIDGNLEVTGTITEGGG